LPPSPPNVPARGSSAPSAQASPFPATGSGAVLAAQVPTDVGVTRGTSAPGRPTPRGNHAPLIIAFAVLVLLCAVGGVVVVRRSALVRVPATHDTTGTAGGRSPETTDRSRLVPALPPTISLATATLEPPPSATALPPAPASGPSSNGASVPTPTSSNKVHVPQNLNGVQPHF
jgi:hypothetical protein